MNILGRKRRRDLWRQKIQFGAVALTIGLGLAGFVAARDAYLDLNGSLSRVYGQLRFADLTVTGGDPQKIDPDQLPGHPLATSRLQADVPLGIGSAKLLSRLVSLPAGGTQPAVNRLEVQSGSLAGDGVAIEHHLAQHFGLAPGNQVTLAGIDGPRVFRVSAVVASPEYLWPARSSQEILTDPSQFGVVFAPESVVKDVAGQSAAPQVSLYAEDRAHADDLVREGRRLAEQAGASDVVDREHQASARVLADDIDAIANYAVLFPLLFLTGAGLGAYILLSRLVGGQRAIIGTLRACGVPAGRLRRHFLGHGLVTGTAGSVLGIALGMPLGLAFAGAYGDAIGLPFHTARLHPTTLVWAMLVGLAAAAAAAWIPARAAARLSPGEAMRVAPVAGTGRRSRAERVLPVSRLPVRWLMVLRGPSRNRLRTLFTLAGVILALILVIVPIGLWDTLQTLIPRQFTVVQREDLQVYPQPGQQPALLAAARADPDTAAAEPFGRQDVTISASGRSHTTLLYAFRPDTVMHGFRGGLPERGVLLPVFLQETMRLHVGDEVDLALPGGTRRAPVSAFVDEPVSAFAYASLTQLAEWTGAATPDAAASAVALRVREGAEPSAVAARYAALPQVAATLDTRALQRSLTDSFDLFNTLIILMALIGTTMAAALLYTTASANITERYMELGSLRAAGMGAGMLGRLAAAENMLLVVGGVIPGVLAGWVLARLFMAAYENDQTRLSLHLRPLTLPVVAVVVVLAAGLAQLPAIRGVSRTDIARVVREHST